MDVDARLVLRENIKKLNGLGVKCDKIGEIFGVTKFTIYGYLSNNPKKWCTEEKALRLNKQLEEVLKELHTVDNNTGLVVAVTKDEDPLQQAIFQLADTKMAVEGLLEETESRIAELNEKADLLRSRLAKLQTALDAVREVKNESSGSTK